MKRSDRNWTIVQILYHDPCPISDTHPCGWEHRQEKYVVYEPLKSDVEKIVEAWLHEDSSQRVNMHVIHYYPRNYVDLERSLRLQGRIIDTNERRPA